MSFHNKITNEINKDNSRDENDSEDKILSNGSFFFLFFKNFFSYL